MYDVAEARRRTLGSRLTVPGRTLHSSPFLPQTLNNTHGSYPFSFQGRRPPSSASHMIVCIMLHAVTLLDYVTCLPVALSIERPARFFFVFLLVRQVWIACALATVGVALVSLGGMLLPGTNAFEYIVGETCCSVQDAVPGHLYVVAVLPRERGETVCTCDDTSAVGRT